MSTNAALAANDKPKRHLEILTTSAVKTFRTCAALYDFQYVQLYRPAHTPDTMAFGTLGHKGLEAWWLAAQATPHVKCEACDPDRMFAVIDEVCSTCNGTGNTAPALWLRAALDAVDSEKEPFHRAAARAVMIGYHCRWSDMMWDGEKITVIAVEKEFDGPLLNPKTDSPSKTWRRGGKLDVFVRVGETRVFVIEHKTSSEDFGPGSDYRRRLRLDSQVSNYIVGARLLGFPEIQGVIYDVIGKTGLKRKSATPRDKQKWTKPTAKAPVSKLYAGQREFDETAEEYESRVMASISEEPDVYFDRLEVVRLEREEDSAARDTWQYGEQIRDARRLKRFPRNVGACQMYGRLCDFIGVCEGTSSLSDQTRFVKKSQAHEELAPVEPWDVPVLAPVAPANDELAPNVAVSETLAA